MLDSINRLDTETLSNGFHRCCASERWVEGMVQALPFTSVEHLQQVAVEVWQGLETTDYLEAFQGHPMIGANLDALRQKFTHTSTWSEGEQAGVQQASEETLLALQQANIAYLERFGYIFIVCATGKSADEMLELLQQRLHNEPDLEIQIAAGEQQKITIIRLHKWLSDL